MAGAPLVKALRAAYAGSTSVAAAQKILDGFITSVKCAPGLRGACVAV